MAALEKKDLFETDVPVNRGDEYSARDIQVLEGLEPIRLRPGMYIGGTDDRAVHHLFAEVIDNSMDEAVAGHASRIEVELEADGFLSVTDNGRGIPVDPHPKYPKKSALEVIMTELHSGGKFSGKAYETSGGLHGVGVSVVNALSDMLEVEVARNKNLYSMKFSQGTPLGRLENIGPINNRRGTKVRFRPDPEIFGPKAKFKPARLFRMTRAKAYLQPGLEIFWKCDPGTVEELDTVPHEAVFQFPGGLSDFLKETLGSNITITPDVFAGRSKKERGDGRVEWAIAWSPQGFGEADSLIRSYCNTVPTPDGGTHEQGLRAALTKGLRAYADISGMGRKASVITPDDVMHSVGVLLSVFIFNPEFQGQTKDRLFNTEVARLVENAVRDPFDHWLASSPKDATRLLEYVIGTANERLRRKKARDVKRKSATKKLRLPGKLADCSRKDPTDTELFIVEGDSAGGSAKQARNRETQAVLPLRGKILNVESASMDKISRNAEINDLMMALGAELGKKFDLEDLRYEHIIIMTDADVDGAHIAALLIAFFYRYMPGLIDSGRLYMAMPPLYKITQEARTAYAIDDAHKDDIIANVMTGRGKIDISRFKGLGEMMAKQLKDTTMNPDTRKLARITIDDENLPTTEALVETLMGKRADLRYRYIQDHAQFVKTIDI
ncbi:MAG: DNA topoisomerase IV subunit B [Hyphomonadaceae bacterium]|nr:DNA topoisomerase IV subunit B [Hyphomonadaceae bacterium]MBC6411677.1 DNA topoisomerase IV subunit B [Hyphomonadaceae bacterium]